jgi:hypothetical protein
MSDVARREMTQHVPRGASRAVFRTAIQDAVLAPSGGDTPPWAFCLRGDTLELHADRSRALPVGDPTGRELVIGCGAALFQLSVALRAAGHEVGVELLPDATAPDFLARVRLDGPHAPTPGDLALAAALRRGWTNCLAYQDREIASHLLSLLLGAARVEGAWLGFIDAPALRRSLAQLVAEAGRRQGDDPRWRHQRAMRAQRNQGALADGLPGWVAATSGMPSHLGAPVPRSEGRDPALSARVRAWVERAATVAVLTTSGDTRADWLVAGQALARVLLTGSAAGISSSYLNPPIEVPDLRPGVAGLLREAADPGVPGRRGGMPLDAAPQIVLRLGYATQAPLAPRPLAAERRRGDGTA